MENGMQARKRIESKVAETDREIAELERQLLRAKSYREGLTDSLKVLPAASVGGDKPKDRPLRVGSELAKVQEILKSAGHALHIDEILRQLGKEINRNTRTGLAGSLSTYANKGRVFTKPSPNTFALIEHATLVELEDPFAVFEDEPPEQGGQSG